MVLTKDVHSGIHRKKLHRKTFYNNDRDKTKKREKKVLYYWPKRLGQIKTEKKSYNNDRERHRER